MENSNSPKQFAGKRPFDLTAEQLTATGKSAVWKELVRLKEKGVVELVDGEYRLNDTKTKN